MNSSSPKANDGTYSASSDSSYYKSAREDFTDSDQSTVLAMDSSADYTFVSNMAEDSSDLDPSSSFGDNTLNNQSAITTSDDDGNEFHPESDGTSTLKDSLPDLEPECHECPKLQSYEVVEKNFTVKMYANLADFEANLPETVSILEHPYGSKVYLIGSAHFSEESMNDVSFVIRNVQPDFVMVELCESRKHILLMDEQALLHEATDLNLAKLRNIYQTNGINSIFYILLLTMSAKLTKDLRMAPGGEFRRAYSEAKSLPQCRILLGDRPINITINRMLRSLSIWETAKLGWRLLTADDTITAEEVELCKQQSLLDKCMAELAQDFPHFEELFVKERDMFMAYSLQNAAMPLIGPDGRRRPVRVVGVVGIGHAAGIKRLWGSVSQAEIERTMVIPKAQLSKVILKNAIKYGFYGLLCFGAYKLIRPRLPARITVPKWGKW